MLPEGISLLAAAEVPVASRSLSQEIRAAVWSFDLQVAPESPRNGVDWSMAVAAITAAEQLIWHDTDKKGRPRQRDCRSALRRLEVLDGSSPHRGRLRLEAEVDEMGRSLRPAQLQHWIAEQQGVSLEIIGLSREALQLA